MLLRITRPKHIYSPLLYLNMVVSLPQKVEQAVFHVWSSKDVGGSPKSGEALHRNVRKCGAKVHFIETSPKQNISLQLVNIYLTSMIPRSQNGRYRNMEDLPKCKILAVFLTRVITVYIKPITKQVLHNWLIFVTSMTPGSQRTLLSFYGSSLKL